MAGMSLIELSLDRTHGSSNIGLMEEVDAVAMTTNAHGDHESRTRGGSEEPIRGGAAPPPPVCAGRAGGGARRPLAPAGDTPGPRRRHAGAVPAPRVPARVFGFDGRLGLPWGAALD